MRRDYYEKRGHGFTIPRGRYVPVIKNMKTPARGYLLMTGQFLIKVPQGVDTVEARFVRVYPGGKRDGTGDVDLFVGHREGGGFQWTW